MRLPRYARNDIFVNCGTKTRYWFPACRQAGNEEPICKLCMSPIRCFTPFSMTKQDQKNSNKKASQNGGFLISVKSLSKISEILNDPVKLRLNVRR
jgi:hypothetical protein